MRISEQLRQCVAFVCYKAPGNNEGAWTTAGTAFFIGVPSPSDPTRYFVFAATAKHVLAGIERTAGPVDIVLRVNQTNGGATLLRSGFDQWVAHSDPYVDVKILAGVQLDPFAYDYKFLDPTLAATPSLIQEKDIGPGDEIFAVGLFVNHIGQHRNVPIVRTGNICALPEEQIASTGYPMDAYLVEARSIGGLSGSPVFVNVFGPRQGALRLSSEVYWLGMMHGHWDTPGNRLAQAIIPGLNLEAVNMGIGIVVPAHKVLEGLQELEPVRGLIEAGRMSALYG